MNCWKARAECFQKEKSELELKLDAMDKEQHRNLLDGVICSAAIKDDDIKTKFYAGLPTYYLFMVLFNFLFPFVNRPSKLN